MIRPTARCWTDHFFLHADALLVTPSKHVEVPIKHQLYVPSSGFKEAVNRAKYAVRMLQHWTLQ